MIMIVQDISRRTPDTGDLTWVPAYPSGKISQASVSFASPGEKNHNDGPVPGAGDISPDTVIYLNIDPDTITVMWLNVS